MFSPLSSSTTLISRKKSQFMRLRVKNPRWAFLRSHPVHDIKREDATTLRQVRSLKLLGLDAFGYNILRHDDDDDEEEEESNAIEEEEESGQRTNKKRKGEEYFDLKTGDRVRKIYKLEGEQVYDGQLRPLLKNCATLRRFNIMLRPNDQKILKELYSCAIRQKNLKEFGLNIATGKWHEDPNDERDLLIRPRNKATENEEANYEGNEEKEGVELETKTNSSPKAKLDFRPFASSLKKLTIRGWERDRITIQGIDWLQNLLYLKLDLPCGLCPVSEGDAIDDVAPVPWFSSMHVGLVKHAQNLQKLRTIHLFSYLLSYEEGFFENLVKVLEQFSQKKLLLKIYSLTGLEEYEPAVIETENIKESLGKLNTEQFQTLFRIFENDFTIALNNRENNKLRGEYFTINDQYMDELEQNVYFVEKAIEQFSIPELPERCRECIAARPQDGFQCEPNGAIHLKCSDCNSLYPDRRGTHPQQCAVCQAFFCNLYLSSEKPHKYNWLQILGEFQVTEECE